MRTSVSSGLELQIHAFPMACPLVRVFQSGSPATQQPDHRHLQEKDIEKGQREPSRSTTESISGISLALQSVQTLAGGRNPAQLSAAMSSDLIRVRQRRGAALLSVERMPRTARTPPQVRASDERSLADLVAGVPGSA